MHCLLHLVQNELATLGYTDLSLLSETDAFRIIRACTHDKQAVLIKAPVSSNPSAKLIHQLEHEFGIASDLNTEYVVRPCKIERSTSLTALILEDCACQPLSALLKAPLEIDHFLTLAVGITSALAEIHRCGLVHKDITPANIFVTADGGIRLSGFGIASRLSRERQALADPQEIAGTLAYMAPEQTGRMNRSIDTRSDLYALGVVFYQMLTGRLPFDASDAMEYVHSHIAIQPKPPQQQRSTIPAPLSTLVMKLLAKAAEERYQTAEGLKIDLQRCQDEWLEGKSIEPFELGKQDISNHLVIPEKLYGRSNEVKRLLSSVDRVVSNGNVEMVLVSGYAGIGKSALINEMHRSLVTPNALYAEGKFDQYKRDTPYATLAQALQGLVRHILGSGEEELAQWRDVLIQALEPNASLVIDLVPELVTLIGEQPPVAEVPPQDAQNRFNRVIQQIINVFAQPEHPLVLFLDDLQWLDAASLQLLEYLLTNPGTTHLLLLGAYRDNEVGPSHPLRRSIETIRNSGVRLSQIELKPLVEEDLCQLIADTLHTKRADILPLAQLVQEKTGGNPFFITQLLSTLADENLLTLNPLTTEWRWDLDSIKLKGYSDNVIDLMVGKLDSLPDQTQKALKQFACLGMTMKISTLARVYGVSEETLQDSLWAALQLGLVLHQKEGYRFLHDKVREAAYSLVSEQERPRVHLHIGNQLLELFSATEMTEHLFDVVNHLNLAADLIDLKEKRLGLVRLNLRAGLKAKASAAFITAADYFNKGLEILGVDPWSVDYDLALSLYAEAIEGEYLKTHYEAALAMADDAMAHARNPLDRAKLGRLKVLIYTQIPDYRQSIETGLCELKALGISLTDTPPEAVDLAEIDKLPPMTDPVQLMAMEIMITLIGSAYIVDPKTLCNLTYTMVEMSRKFGNSAPSIYAYGLFGVLLVDQGKVEQAYQFGKAGLTLCTDLKAPEMQSMALNMFNSCIRHWKEPLNSALPDMAKGVEVGLAYGDIENVAYCANHYCNNLLFSGTALEQVESTVDYHLALVKKLRQWYAVGFLNITRQTTQNLVSPSSTPGSLNGDYVKEDELLPTLIENNNYTLLFWFYTAKTVLNVLFGRCEEATQFAEKAKPHEKSSLGLIAVGELVFYHSLAVLGRCRGADKSLPGSDKAVLKESKTRLSHLADHARENFRHKYDLILAEEARVEGRILEAMKGYEKAIAGALDNGFIHEAALTYELTAKCYLGHDMQESSRLQLLQASALYAQWGAAAKVRDLAAQFPHWLMPVGADDKAEIDLDGRLDAITMVKASQAVSSEIELAKLIQTLMINAVENAGADRGLLATPGSDGMAVEAEARAGENGILVTPVRTPITGIDCAHSIINTTAHTLKSIIIDDSSHPESMADDPYLRQGKAKSILCLPLIRHGNLAGVLYLENSQTPGVFNQNRLAVLDVLATQAAISLENSHLYDTRRESEEKFRALLQKVQAAVVVHGTDTQILTANTMAQDLLGLSEAQLLGKTAIDPDWHFLREDESLLPPEEFPVNRVLASKHALQNTVIGIDRPDRIEILWALVNAAPLFNETGGITHVIVSFSDISERKRAEQQLTASEQLFRTLVENSPDHIARYDLNLRRVYLNPALQKLFTAPLNQVLQKTSKTDSPLLDPKAYMANLQQVIDSGLEISDEIAFRTAQGQVHWANSRFAPELNTDGKVQSVLVISNDITEQKQAEIERLDHMHFLESLDRINRVLQTQGTFEKTMSTALSEVLDIFDCDRACLIYPCDPDAETWSVPLESTRPAFPGAGPHGPQPMEEEMAAVMRALLEKERPLRIGPEGDYPITPLAREKYNTRAVLATILRPKADKPWQFGLQQCSHERSWSDQEVRLFEEIGHRLSDGLNSLLSTRDMRQSEARFRLVFESSPVSIQEEDYSAVKAHLESLRPEYGDDLATYLVDHPQVAHECAALVRIIDINQAALRFHQAGTKEEFLRDLPQIFMPETMPAYRQILVSLMRGETHLRVESEIRTLTGQQHPIDIFISVCSGYEQSLARVLVSLVDISEIKQAEQERQEHLHFLKSLDRINKVLQSEGSIEEILKRTLDEVLDIFDCDRTYLQYPCDPDASAEWWMPMERCKPEYPSTLAPGGRLPYHPHIEETLRAMRDRDTPIRLGPETDHPIPAEITENLGVRSLLAIALRPKVDRPWHFGIHQCTHDRIWTDQEARLFQEIAHRFSDGLNNLLITRDLRESEERFRLVYENSPVSVREEDFSAVKSRLDEFTMNYGDDLEDYLLAHPESVKECAALVRIVNVNNATLELHEADSKAELFDGLPKTFIPESYDAFRKELMAIAKGETELILDGVVQTLSGKRRDVSISFSVCPGYEDKLSKVFVSMFDITQRKVDEENLRLAASVFSTSQEGILISDADNRIIDINPAFTRLTGYSREETLGQNPSFLSAGRQNPTFYAEMWQSIHSTGEWQGEIWNQRKSGEIFPELLSIVAIKDDQGRLQHYVGAFTDISMIKQHEADLDRIAHYDMLTSVPNRRLLGDRLEQAIAHARRHEKNLAVCYLDLDGFKPINDQFGHEGGDRMLIEIAHRLETMSRAEDTVSRLGGDEFVLLWSDIGSETDCANALERVLNKVAEPMLLDNQMASVSASIGVTLYPDDNVDADSLLRHADHAMYMAKQLGKNRYQIFDARLERQISAQVELMEKISRGLERGQFELYYQPKVDYTTCETVGAEALLRWNDPVLGLVGPKEFISLIENDILAFRMGRWVMEQAIQQARIWYEKGITLPISINVFPRHLKNRTFVDDLRSTIASIWPQMPRNQLVIEIVETNDLEELEPIEQVIKQCLGMGIGFSLDDFGTGYSSLVYLRRLSIQELKIDQSFVRDMLEDPEDEAIVVGVIRLGQAFGLQVVAEGVETTEQAQYLVDIGCHIVQGYGMGRPMPAHTLEKWYAAFNAMELNVCRK